MLVFLLLLCLACDSKVKNIHTFDEFKEDFMAGLVPMGTYFWDEFGDIETKYGLTENESKLLGKWSNMTFNSGPGYNDYVFFPNKFFLLGFSFKKFRIVDAEEMYLNKALGTWEIVNGIVRITIYTVITEDYTKKHPNNKDVFFVEQPYTVDLINIDDIDEQGFTKRPINDAVLSKELQQMVTVQKNPSKNLYKGKKVTKKERNKANNLHFRNVYTIDVIPELAKNYGYFSYFPEMARENHSGLDIVMNPDLIKKYIPDWMY